MRLLFRIFVLLFCLYPTCSDPLNGYNISQHKQDFPAQHRETCTSPIYCEGEILNLVQSNKIFNDSKTFVDMAMKNPVDVTLNNFDLFMRRTSHKPTRQQIRNFVLENFGSVGELEDHYPLDFNPEPSFVKEIDISSVKKFTKELVSLWPQLTRRVAQRVYENPETHSIIPVKNPFIVPGGRFREYYYWDTYWIIKGLLLSDMKDTAKGMIENLLSMVERYGYVPNGGRIYYINRSQPPVLTLIMADYVSYTKDFEFLRHHIRTLERELNFWLTRRVTTFEFKGHNFHLAHFDSESDTPRAESYREDIETCAPFHSKDGEHECYAELKSGAESGWDFTVRWLFDEDGGPTTDLSKISTRRNIPVDLNSFLYRAFFDMYRFHVILRQPVEAKYWLSLANQWAKAIETVLYNKEDGIWYDFDVKLGKPRKFFVASNITPLWAGAVAEELKEERARIALSYLKEQGVLDYHGIPSTKIASGQQWDYPNAWSPYQNIIIFGLHKAGDESVKEEAKIMAHKWVTSVIKAFNQNRVMFEKYDAEISGNYGGGGEYQIQAGFGWTNGSIMEIIDFFFRNKKKGSPGLEN